MRGVLSFINSNGYGFIEVVDEQGLCVTYFALRRRVIIHRDWWSQNAICEFQISPAPPRKKDGLSEAVNIEIIKAGIGCLDSRVLRGEGGVL